MIFIIGGSYQGKRAYAQERFDLTDADIFLCTEDTTDVNFDQRIIAGIEKFALGCVKRGEEPMHYWQANMNKLQNSILISDDVSCGIVPIDETIRAWREATGRANNYIAREAKQVIRVFCGIGQVIKE